MKLALVVCLLLCSSVHGKKKKQMKMGMADDEDFGKCFLAFFKSWIPDDLDVDVMMALDSSSSVKKQGFNKGKAAFQIANNMVQFRTASGITGSINGTRSGFLQFASKEKTAIKIHLPQFDNVDYLNDEIGGQEYTGGATAISKALALAGYEFFFLNPNYGRIKRILLATDGKETEGGKPVKVANYLKKHGVEICVVSIGKNVAWGKLKAIATEYQIHHKMLPCVSKAKNWREFKTGMRKAARLLEQGFEWHHGK